MTQQQLLPTKSRHPGSRHLLSVSVQQPPLHPSASDASQPGSESEQALRNPSFDQIHVAVGPIVAPTPTRSARRPLVAKLDFKNLGLSRAIDFGA